MDAARLHVAWGSAVLLERQAALAGAARMWSGEERARLGAIASPSRRRQFVAARWLLRTLLADVHGGTPQEWLLSAGDGPPRVMHAARAPIHLASSHSADVVACALAPVPVGVDVEAPARRRDVLALAEIACDDTEQALLRSQPPSMREGTFYELWTAKEAWIKSLALPMAPRRMARIHLRPAPLFDTATVRVWAKDHWMLALAAPAGLPLHWHAEVPAARSAWTVDDEGEGVRSTA